MPERWRIFCDVGHSAKSSDFTMPESLRPILIRYREATTAFHPMVRHFARAGALQLKNGAKTA
jgi:hypothetical protein